MCVLGGLLLPFSSSSALACSALMRWSWKSAAFLLLESVLRAFASRGRERADQAARAETCQVLAGLAQYFTSNAWTSPRGAKVGVRLQLDLEVQASASPQSLDIRT